MYIYEIWPFEIIVAFSHVQHQLKISLKTPSCTTQQYHLPAHFLDISSKSNLGNHVTSAISLRLYLQRLTHPIAPVHALFQDGTHQIPLTPARALLASICQKAPHSLQVHYLKLSRYLVA
jgi:hypothetical protein